MNCNQYELLPVASTTSEPPLLIYVCIPLDLTGNQYELDPV